MEISLASKILCNFVGGQMNHKQLLAFAGWSQAVYSRQKNKEHICKSLLRLFFPLYEHKKASDSVVLCAGV